MHRTLFNQYLVFLSVFLFAFQAYASLPKDQEQPKGILETCDLDDQNDGIVLEAFQIDIPGYPEAFNPSVVQWQGQNLLSFRHFVCKKGICTSFIGLVWLDENFKAISSPQLLNTRKEHPKIPSRSEDARIFCIDDHLYVIYNDDISQGNNQGRRLYIAEVLYENNKFYCLTPICLSNYPKTGAVHEKNWTPFVHNNNLYLSYSLNPHKVLVPDLTTGSCPHFYTTSTNVKWSWGELRGGTPALDIGGEYLAFFHTMKFTKSPYSNSKVKYHYVMGAYTFNQHPPFELTHISPNPIAGCGMFKGSTNREKVVVFPGGFTFDNDYIWVVYGKDDTESWVVKLDKHRLLDSLIPIKAKRKN